MLLAPRTGLCLVVALFLGSTRQSQTPRTVTGIYTDMASSDGEHIGGTEIFLVQGGGKYYVMIQTAEGTSSIPLVVPASVAGDTLTFDLRGTIQADLGQFRGRIAGGQLVGAFSGWRTTLSLPRRSSFWQR